MKKNLALLNWILTFIIILGLAGTSYTWMVPNYPSRIDGSIQVASPRQLEKPVVTRKNIPATFKQQITDANLFRKERVQYSQPQAPAVAAKPNEERFELPPPKLALKGVLLLGGTQIAMINGTYPIRETNNKITDKPVKRRPYKIGDKIGHYKIKSIEKTYVTLSAKSGQDLTLKVSNQNQGSPIQREGTQLFHKDPSSRNFQRRNVSSNKRPTNARPDEPRSPRNKPVPRASRPRKPKRNLPPSTNISGAKVPRSKIVDADADE